MPDTRRAQTIELTGTCLSIFLSGQFGMTLMNNGLPVTIYVFFWNSVFLATFIFATAPGSGGHINPAITFTVMLAGLCPVPRGTLTG
jgi:glycerol uptake facilitator-like aquaporin